MTHRFDPELYDEPARRMAEGLAAAEERLLAAKRRREDCACKEGMFPDPGRRQVLSGAVALAGAGATALLAGRASAAAPPGAVEYDVPEDPTKVQGRLTGADGGYGTRSQFETEVRWRFPTATQESSWTMTPLEDGQGIITPSGLHFERHHGGIPTIDPARHELIVHGMVQRPKKYTMADLQRFPSISRFHFIECSGNGLTEWREPTLKTVQGTHGLTSTSEWTGVPLSTILREVGITEGAVWILAEGADAAVMTRSVPLDKAWSDALLAYGQNGEAIRPEQGYPLRLILPGWEGNTHIKWLRRLEVSDQPFMTREETSKYTDLVNGGKARQFSFAMEAKSVITFPSGDMKLPGPGFYEVTGLAWSGRGRVQRVEVSTDGGQNWALAALQDPILPVCHTRFRFPWRWDGQPAVLQSRCMDETGYVQPTLAELVAVRGLDGGKFGSIYHLNAIQSWGVASDGSVSNVHA
jgi:sulfane dehydrogenase subunit SoxC